MSNTIDALIDSLFEYLYSKTTIYKRRKELDEKINLYTEVYKNETENFEKAYWLARVWNLQYERKCLE